MRKPAWLRQLSLLVGMLVAASLLLTTGGIAFAKAHGGPKHVRPTAHGTVTIGYINWPEDVAATYLWQHLLEQHGYNVKLVLADVGPTYEGLATDSVNLFFDAWLPHDHGPYWYGKADKSAEIIDRWYLSPTQEGFVVPDYVKVTSIPQLKNDSSLFKGVIVGIEPGAGLTRLSQEAIKAYGLPETLEVSSTPAMLAELAKAEASHQPIVVTLWSPMWAFAKWKLHYLADPKNVFGPGDNVFVLGNDKFVKANPQIVAWLKKFKMDQTDLGQLEILINKYPNNPQKAVTAWISTHESLVKSWF